MMSNLLASIRKCGVGFDVYLNGGFKFSSLVGADKKKLPTNLPNEVYNLSTPLYHRIMKKKCEVNGLIFYCP